MHLNKKKYILFTILCMVCIFLLTSFLLVSMTLRYYVKSDAVLQALESVALESMQITLNEKLRLLLKILNKLLQFLINKGQTGLFLRIMSSGWIQPVLILLLIGTLIWIVKIHIRGNRKIGTAFQIFGITACIPGSVAFVSGRMLSKTIALLNLPDRLETALQGKMVFCSGVSIVICIILFCSGIIWNKKIKS